MSGSIYVCSDLHGQYNTFKKMLEDIEFSENDTLYVLGDIIDRGPASMQLMQDIMKWDNIVALLGNHELMMYDYLKHNRNWKWWMNPSNGGDITLEQYQKLSEEEKEKVLKYITDMYLQVELTLNDQTFLLSHSSFIPERGTMKSVEASPYEHEHVTWDSPWRFWEYEPESSYKQDGRTHIIGHVPVQRISNAKMPVAYESDYNIINIDLGCSLGTDGWLCCMNLTKYANEEEGVFRYWRGQ